MSAVIENHHDDHHHGPAKGITRWLYTTNHKDIGTLYLWFSFAMFLIGGAMAMVIRAENTMFGAMFHDIGVCSRKCDESAPWY